MAEIVPVVSEALEAQIRALLPSQRGFGQDLQASNVITPIIDLTAAAQGTTTPQYMQTAIAFGSQTTFEVIGSTAVLANTAGFFRIFGVSSIRTDTSFTVSNSFSMSDGLSTKNVWLHKCGATATNDPNSLNFDFTVFLQSGESISASASSSFNIISGSYRQVADVNGNLINPVGFTPQ